MRPGESLPGRAPFRRGESSPKGTVANGFRWLSTFTLLGALLIVLGLVGLILGPRFVYDPGQTDPNVLKQTPWYYLAVGALMLVNGLLTPQPADSKAEAIPAKPRAVAAPAAEKTTDGVSRHKETQDPCPRKSSAAATAAPRSKASRPGSRPPSQLHLYVLPQAPYAGRRPLEPSPVVPVAAVANPDSDVAVIDIDEADEDADLEIADDLDEVKDDDVDKGL